VLQVKADRHGEELSDAELQEHTIKKACWLHVSIFSRLLYNGAIATVLESSKAVLATYVGSGASSGGWGRHVKDQGAGGDQDVAVTGSNTGYQMQGSLRTGRLRMVEFPCVD
jgi:hypothetical protein